MVDRRTAALAIILVSYFMIVLDISIVITGLPKILESLSFSATGLSWVQNAYTLAFGGLLLLRAGVGASVGLVVGGIVADWLSWRVGFFINVPIGIALMLGAQRYLGESERRSGEFDVAGALTSTLGMTGVVYGLVRSASAGWSDRVAVAALTAGVVLLALLVLNEWRAKQPIMPLRLFANGERVGA